jgi:hypothetical protein
MRLGPPGGDHFIAYLFREGNIYKRIPMDVTNLALSDDIFHAAEAMGL